MLRRTVPATLQRFLRRSKQYPVYIYIYIYIQDIFGIMHGVSGFGDASDEMSQEDDMPQTKWITESSQEDDMPRGCQHVSAQNPWPSNKETGRTSAGIIRAARRNVISGGSFGDVYIYICIHV